MTTPKTPSHKSTVPPPEESPLHNKPNFPIDQDLGLELSPSKARQAAQTSQAWNLVNQWLSSIYQRRGSDQLSQSLPSQSYQDTLRNDEYSANKHLSLPNFERNDATLAALQALMRVNKEADEINRLVHEARKTELDPRRRQNEDSQYQEGSNLKRSLVSAIEQSLHPKGKEALDSLASATSILGISPSAEDDKGPISKELISKTIQLQHQTFTLEQQIREFDHLCRHLTHPDATSGDSSPQTRPPAQQITPHGQVHNGSRSEFLPTLPRPHERTQDSDHETHHIQPSAQDHSSHFQSQHRTTTTTTPDPSSLSPETLRQQISQYQLETTHLQAKIQEYTRRITSLNRVIQSSPPTYPRTSPSPSSSKEILSSIKTLTDHIQIQTTRIAEKRERLTDLENEVKAFGGLPPDIELSRMEVRRAIRDLDSLKRRREEIFEQL